MTVSFIWHGARVSRQIDNVTFRGIKAVGFELHRISRRSASVKNQGKRHTRTRSTSRGPAGSQYTTYPNSSKPGESPRRRTGFGQKNIVWGSNRQKMESRVGYTKAARYMTYHELGIRYRHVGFQQRPTIIPSVRNNQARLAGIMRRFSGGRVSFGGFG